MIEIMPGISAIAANYDGYIVDLWGVVHNGVTPYPAALECLRRLQGKPVLLLSNAPRRAASAQGMLRRMGVGDELYTDILTSGEATWRALHDRTDPWFARLGTRAYHLGPLRDRNVLEGLGLSVVSRPDEADFMLNTGPDDDAANATTLELFIPELQACLAAGLPMICANPDLVVVRDGVRLLCAGSLARYYAAAGGDVYSLGKPDPAIYAMALGMLGLPAARVLAIGDSLHTDIAGACGAGIDNVWVLGGIHYDAIGGDSGLMEAAVAEHGVRPSFTVPFLGW
jgi:HAD superfamily hydrolase (TIGR01459 family)